MKRITTYFLIPLIALMFVFGSVAVAEANILGWIFSPVTSLAQTIAKGIVTVVKGNQTAVDTATEPTAEIINRSANTDQQRTEDMERISRYLQALELLNRQTTSPVLLEVANLDQRLTRLEQQFEQDYIDLDTAMQASPAAPVVKVPVPVVVDTKIPENLAGQAYSQAVNPLESVKDVSANSSGFKSFFADLKEKLDPQTKSWAEYTTNSSKQQKINPPDIAIKMNSGIKLFSDGYDDKKLQSYHWDNEKSVVDEYTSTNLNLDNDSKLMNTAIFKGGNDQFKNVYMNAGNTKFGWTHIAHDRPDGTNHAREIKEHFGLPNQDKAVQTFIQDTIKQGKGTEQIRMVDGKPQSRFIYTRDVDGKEIKVVVDNSKYPGSVVTAYPTGKVKAPTPAEVKQRIEEEKRRKAEDLKKNVRWRSPKVYVDLYKRQKTLTLGPQLKGGTSQSFRVGGADIVNGAQGDLLLGTELTGATYAGFVDKTLSAGVRGNVFLGARARGEVSSAVQVGEVGVRGFLGGEVGIGASARGDAHVGIGPQGLEGRISGDAFVGVRAKGRVGGTVSYGDVKATGSLNGTVGVGLGAHFDVHGKIGWSGVKAHVDLGAYLGVGGQLGFDINLDFGNKLDPIKKAVGKAVDKGKKVVKNVTGGLKKAANAVGKFFSW